MNEFLLPLFLIGTTLIVVRGSIFNPVRRLKYLSFLGCAQCVGFWVGAGTGASGIVSTGYGRALDALIVGGASSFLSLLADAVLLKLLGDPNDIEEKS